MAINRRQIPLPEEVYNPYQFGEAFGQNFAKSVINEIENAKIARAKEAESKRDFAMKLALQQQSQEAELGKAAMTGGKLQPVGGKPMTIGGTQYEPIEKPKPEQGLLFYNPDTFEVFRGTPNKPENKIDPLTLTEDDKKYLQVLPSKKDKGMQSAKMLEVQSSVITRFNADASTKKSQQALDAAGDIINFAESGNPIGANAIPTYSSRMSGEVGNLSEADKRPFGGSLAIKERINASLTQMGTGRLSEANKKFIIEFSNLVKTRANEKMDKLAQLRAKQYGSLKDQPFGTAKEIYNYLRPAIEETNKTQQNIQVNWTTDKERRYQELKSKMGGK